MVDSNFIASACSLTYFASGLILLNYGDASQLSYKTLQLMYVQVLFEIPFLFLEEGFSFFHVIFYGCNISVITRILIRFRTPDDILHDTYRPELDNFPFHGLLPVLAIVFALIVHYRSKGDGVNICYESALRFEDAQMTMTCGIQFLWMASYCLMPLMFMPQLRMCFNLNDDLQNSCKTFLVCMMVYVAMEAVLDISFNPRWHVSIVCSTVAIFVLGLPFFRRHKRVACCSQNQQAAGVVPSSGYVLMETELEFC